MKLYKPCFQKYFHFLQYENVELIPDSLMFIKNPKLPEQTDTFFTFLKYFSQNLLFGLITLLNSLATLSSIEGLFFLIGIHSMQG